MTERMTAAEFKRQTPRVGGRRVTPETAVKQAVKQWLDLHGWRHWPNTAGMGVYPGLPDIEAIKDGRTVYIECKAPRGKLSVGQERFRDLIEECGGTYLVVYGIEDLEVLR